MRTERIKCFIAMAFGRKDCDGIYNDKILPVMRKLKIEPIRVDRRQHKDDLNNYIIRMIKEADIALVDLTYSRPSVYYEAGFAERCIPVAYITRADHLKLSQEDESLRVHFDLRMKKIVVWDTKKEISFKRKLFDRLQYLSKPILVEQENDNRKKEEERHFSMLSMTERCNMMSRQFIRLLEKKRFWVKPLFEIDRGAYGESSPLLTSVAAKIVCRKAIGVTIAAASSVCKKQIHAILHRAAGDQLIAKQDDDRIRHYENHIVFCSCARISESRLAAVLPDAMPTKDEKCFRMPDGITSGGRKVSTTIWLFGSVSTERAAADAARECLGDISDDKTNSYTSLVSIRRGHNMIIFKRK